jgi:hypothetical protein
MRKCNAGAAPSGGGGALLERPAVRSEGRGSLVVDFGGYTGLPKALALPFCRYIEGGSQQGNFLERGAYGEFSQ